MTVARDRMFGRGGWFGYFLAVSVAVVVGGALEHFFHFGYLSIPFFLGYMYARWDWGV